MNHPDIDKAERYGMPEGKLLHCKCRAIVDEDTRCAYCGGAVCDSCKIEIADEYFCDDSCADVYIRKELVERDKTIYDSKKQFMELYVILEKIWKYRDEEKLFDFCCLFGQAVQKCKRNAGL